MISNFDIICRFHGKEKRMSHFWNSDSRLTWMIHLKIISEREILLSGKYENERKTSSSLSTDKLNISRIWNIEWKTIQRCYSNCYRGNYLECDASCIQNLFFYMNQRWADTCLRSFRTCPCPKLNISDWCPKSWLCPCPSPWPKFQRSHVRVWVCFGHGLGHELMSELLSVHLWFEGIRRCFGARRKSWNNPSRM